MKLLFTLPVKHDDLQTVHGIINSVTDHMQRTQLLSVQDKWSHTVLHRAARSASEDTMTFILYCLPPENIINIMKLRDWWYFAPLHVSAEYNKHDTVCLVIVSFLLSVYNTYQSGIYIVDIVYVSLHC